MPTNNTISNVSAGKPQVAGAIFRAPVGSTLPTDATTALDAAFKALGYISQDGVTNGNAISSEDYYAWGGNHVLNMATSRADTFQFTPIESLNPEVLKLYYGDANVSGTLTSGIVVNANAKDLGEHAYVIDMLARDGAVKRLVIPSAKVTTAGDVVYRDNQPVGYQVTLAAMPDSSGNTHYEYIKRASGS